MSLFFANIFGWFVGNWRWLLPLVAAVIIVGFIGFGLSKCGSSSPKFDEERIRKNQQAIATQDREVMEKAFEESKLDEAKIDQNRADAENKKIETLSTARKDVKQMTNQELADYLEGR